MEGTFHLTCCGLSILSSFREYPRQKLMQELHILHLGPLQVVNLPLSTQEFLKPTSVSIEFSSKAIKLLNLLAKLCRFMNFPRTLFLWLVVVCLWALRFHCLSTLLQ